MRTLYINGRFLSQRTTGVQRHARCLLQALDALLAAGTAPPLRVELLLPPGAIAPTLRAVHARVVPGGRGHAWEQWSLPRAARAGLLLNLAGAAPAFARAQVATLHDAALWDQPGAYTVAFRSWYRWLFRRLARRAEALLTVSDFSRQRLAAALQVPPSRLHVVAAGAGQLDGVVADEGVIARLGLQGLPYLLAVGSANPTKNLPRLLAAFARLQQQPAAPPGLRLVVVGGGSAAVFASVGGSVGASAGTAGGAAAGAAADPTGVLRTGPLEDAPLKALYRHAQALVFPSLYEGAGLPPLEAMACGCPVIAADIPALRETCAGAALFTDPLDTDALAAAMARLLNDPALRQRLVAAGQAHAATRRWDTAARQLLALLHPLLAGPPDPAHALHATTPVASGPAAASLAADATSPIRAGDPTRP